MRERENAAIIEDTQTKHHADFPSSLSDEINKCLCVRLSLKHTYWDTPAEAEDSKSIEGSFIQKLDFCRCLLTLVSLQTRFPEQQIVFSLLSQKINQSLIYVTLFNLF